MSLLMQALKKAEHSKQAGESSLPEPEANKALVPDDALTLSPKHTDLTYVPPSQAMSESTESAGAGQPASESSVSGLSLSPQTPQIQDKPVDLLEDDVGLAPLSRAESAALQGKAEHFRQETSNPLEQDPPGAAHLATGGAAPADNDKSVGTAHKMPDHFSSAQSADNSPRATGKPTVEQERIATQEKAKSVFSAKINKSGHRSLVLVSLGILAVLAGMAFAYWYWQNTVIKSSFNLPASSPPIIPQVVPPQTDATPASLTASTGGAVENPVAGTTGNLPGVASVSNAVSPEKVLATVPASNALVIQSPPPVSADGNMPVNVELKPAKPAAPAIPVGTAKLTNTDTGEVATAKGNLAAKGKMAPVSPIQELNSIHIKQGSQGNQIHPGVLGAYQSFIAGDAPAAKSQYQKVLQQEPNNRDALLGMAVISLNQRQPEQAGSFYTRLLELDPTDTDAIAGLTSMQQGDPQQSESRLKKILTQNPQAGPILFALGNLYAQQARWNEAQQTYFRAYTSAPANADYAFNLAVSLDRLNQLKLAQEYYLRALTLGQTAAVNFSRENVQRRVKELASAGSE
ncbi:tetratricopeptide repeat protein [Undibacterium sp. RuTC16W]|uniref:tetratricopeptide repeat protein n=1 Tax=Undibacterium sp. RuTC16W TaxID=3413048 RepID=UPI003BF35539